MNRLLGHLSVLSVCTLLGGACADQSAWEPTADAGQPDDDTALDNSSAALQQVTDCDNLDDRLRATARAELQVLLAQAKQGYKTSACPVYMPRDAGVRTTSYAPPSSGDAPSQANNASSGASAPSSAATPSPSSKPSASSESSPASAPSPVVGDSDAPTEVSSTNNQVAGVDEADIVKTDGKYLYVVSKGVLHVLASWPADSTHEVSQVKLPGSARELLLKDGRAVVFTAINPKSGAKPCTYGYDCDFIGDGSSTSIVVLDVSVPEQPRQLRQIDVSGSLLTARRIGDTVHAVFSDGPVSPAVVPRLNPVGLARCGVTQEEIDTAFEELSAQNEASLAALDFRAPVPTFRDSLPMNGVREQCQGFYAAAIQEGGAYASLLSFALSNEEPFTTSTIVSRPGAIYVSDDSLYIAVREQTRTTTSYSTSETSVVHRFAIGASPSDTRYAASGRVRGHALNQFAMDEWQGSLRIATTDGRVPSATVKSNLSVLQQTGHELRIVGRVENIAPKEDIRSVRFAGPRGYVVTFKKTDPLFVFDLADPTAPRIAGELKIPGFSTYMQALDDGHLLTIGYDAADQGSFAYFQGVLLQIFDVSNPAQPTLAHKEVIGTRGSSSEALTNHLAFNYFAPKKLLALPMTICEGADGASGQFGNVMTFSGLMLYDIDVSTGFHERGRVAHPTLLTGAGPSSYDSTRCSNWWSDASSAVQRSVFMDDYVYSIATDVVRVQSLSSLGTDVATTPLR
jgi:hypothetical protein